ncbi:MAG: helix-turn-helix domain-containing protein [Dehalococcoidales bacterium]|nr:helix-turn-helix domain-containing protein [Dehalococcoidales bacterium]
MTDGYLNLKEAREYLGISRVKMTKLVKDGVLKAIPDPLDSRSMLVKKDDVEKLRLRDK